MHMSQILHANNIKQINNIKQKEVDEITRLNNTLNQSEDILREKIYLKYQELDNLKKQFDNIFETYNQIVLSCHK